jgi:hypothetical protein
MFSQNILPVANLAVIRRSILSVLIGLMGGGVVVLAQQTAATPAAQPAAQTAAQPAATADAATISTTTPDASKPDAVAATPALVIPSATPEAERLAEAQQSAEEPMDAATAKAVKRLADKFRGKKGKQPKQTPMDIEQGTLTVDGWTGKARMNYDIADLKYLFVWAPGVGTVVISNGWFPQSDIQTNAFSGNTITVTVKGHTIQIASDKRLLGKKPVSAFVYLDTRYRFPSVFPVMGYGPTPLPPYAWPGATKPTATQTGVVVPPPLPVDLRPVLAPPGCPPPGSKQALNMTPCTVIPPASRTTATAAATMPVAVPAAVSSQP